MQRTITKRQREVFEYLKEFVQTYGHSPTIRDIAARFKLSSPATVHRFLVHLEEAGMIVRGKRNSLVQLVKEEVRREAVEIPLHGKIAAGQPIEAVASEETIAIPDTLLGKRSTYALRVVGDSMIEDHIEDGDIIVVESRETAENGEMVVALVDDHEATVKRFYRESGRVRLQPANAALAPMYYSPGRVKIQGVVIGVVRRY